MRNLAKFASRKGPKDAGFSLIELLIVVAIILIIAAIAIPNFLRAKINANQAGAVASIHTIAVASVNYLTEYNDGYPASLAVLGGSGTASCTNAMLLDPVLGSTTAQKSGYQFAYTGSGGTVTSVPAGCAAGSNGYFVTAAPIVNNITGSLSYCSTETGVIYFDTTGAVSASAAACATLPSQ